jgi:hypothetical protein
LKAAKRPSLPSNPALVIPDVGVLFGSTLLLSCAIITIYGVCIWGHALSLEDGVIEGFSGYRCFLKVSDARRRILSCLVMAL